MLSSLSYSCFSSISMWINSSLLLSKRRFRFSNFNCVVIANTSINFDATPRLRLKPSVTSHAEMCLHLHVRAGLIRELILCSATARSRRDATTVRLIVAQPSATYNCRVSSSKASRVPITPKVWKWRMAVMGRGKAQVTHYTPRWMRFTRLLRSTHH